MRITSWPCTWRSRLSRIKHQTGITTRGSDKVYMYGRLDMVPYAQSGRLSFSQPMSGCRCCVKNEWAIRSKLPALLERYMRMPSYPPLHGDAHVVYLGIGYETWYFVCLFCDLIVCNDCHGNHPQSHIQWFRHRRTRMMPRGANPELAECQKCMKMVHCRIQCAQCAVAFCSGCISRDARSCLENHEHRVDELVPPPEMGVLEIREPCRTCPSKGSTAHCGRCGQGRLALVPVPLRMNGWYWQLQVSRMDRFGQNASLARGSMVQQPHSARRACLEAEKSTTRRTNGDLSSTRTNRQQTIPAGLNGSASSASKRRHCRSLVVGDESLIAHGRIDVAISNSLRKHAHNNFLFSYGRDVRQQVVKRNWKACANKPVRHDDAANEELLSKSSAKCCLCGSCRYSRHSSWIHCQWLLKKERCTGFLNLGKICMCLTCRTTYCVHCFERGPGKLHEHYCVQLYINCEKPPNHLYQLAQAICQRSCAMCRGNINRIDRLLQTDWLHNRKHQFVAQHESQLRHLQGLVYLSILHCRNGAQHLPCLPQSIQIRAASKRHLSHGGQVVVAANSPSLKTGWPGHDAPHLCRSYTVLRQKRRRRNERPPWRSNHGDSLFPLHRLVPREEWLDRPEWNLSNVVCPDRRGCGSSCSRTRLVGVRSTSLSHQPFGECSQSITGRRGRGHDGQNERLGQRIEAWDRRCWCFF